MIILKLMGGLGNQLFIYGSYSKLTQQGKNVYLECSDYNLPDNNNFREYLLRYFISDDIKLCQVISFKSYIKRIIQKKIDKKIKYIHPFQIRNYKRIGIEESRMISSDFTEISDKTYLTGYFASDRFFPYLFNNYFYFNKKTINSLCNKKIYNDIVKTNSVSVHIRRTDYLKEEQFRDICTEKYYQNSIEYISQNKNNLVFYFFSDDINYVKNKFGMKENYVFINNSDNKESTISDIFFMSLCKNMILANSTYSWWAAFFNKNANAIICRPPRWSNSSSNDSIYLESWIKIENK